MAFNIIVKNYEHHNTSFRNWDTPKGKYIRSKRHYQNEMAKGNFIPYEEASRIVEAKQEIARNRKLTLSKDSLDIIRHASSIADRKGKVKLGDRAVDKLISMKVVQDQDIFAKHLPKHYTEKGGFDNAT